MLGSATGSEIMQRIAAPMVGGVFTVWIAALFILPAIYYLWHARGLTMISPEEKGMTKS
jgi:Cu(I)/Ag(I) efflux system membrane protein CusA/SilA